MRPPPTRFSTLLVALGLDLLFGEPPALIHPVVWMGIAIGRIESSAPRHRLPRLAHGGVHVAAITATAALAGVFLSHGLRAWPPIVAVPIEGALLKTTLSLRGLIEAGWRVERDLDRQHLGAARRDVRALVSRDPGALDQALLASAAVESIAENASDSVLAPLLFYVAGGLPAALAYRAVNTLDAMIGYHGEHEYSGKAAAVTDDLLNYVPARLTAAAIVIGAALAGGDVRGAWETLRRDRSRTESPNAGWLMSAMAGALGVRLEKPGAYRLGAPLAPADTPAIDHAIQILLAAMLAALPLLFGLAHARQRKLR